jgi:hypothetical protein
MKTFGIKMHRPKINHIPILAASAAFVVNLVFASTSIVSTYQSLSKSHQQITATLEETVTELDSVKQKLAELEGQDQFKINQQLETNLKQTNQVFNSAITVYEKMLDNEKSINTNQSETTFASILADLAVINYTSASAKVARLSQSIDQAITAASATKGIDLAALTISTTPPDSGYQRQKVVVDGVEYVVDIVAANLASTKILVDTASDSDCTDNCPVLPLATYAARNSAFAAVNGTYFCPASYPSCAGKTNTFDLLVMNKNKTYFNSDNNVYSTNPAVIFQGNSIRFVGRASEWGRDTGIDSMLSNYPLLVSGGTSQFGGDNDPKKSSIATRPFIASKGSMAYIGIIRGASVATAAKVLVAMGMEHAMNLDSGGSTALWVNGSYKAGPGRDIPNAIVFVRK